MGDLISEAKRPAQICRERGIDATTLRRWRADYERDSEAAWSGTRTEEAPSESKIAALRRLIGQLTVENDLL